MAILRLRDDDLKKLVEQGLDKYIWEHRFSKNILSETRHVMTEERGINDLVKRKTQELINIIPTKLENIEFQKNEYGIPLKTCSFVIKFGGSEININVTCYYFNDMMTFYNFGNLTTSNYDYENKELNINIACINGQFNTARFEGAIQHELTHVLQDLKKTSTDTEIGGELYSTIVDMVDNTNSIKDRIGYTLYLSQKIEIETFGNTLYALLVKNRNKPWQDVYRNSEIYNQIMFLKWSLKVFNDPSYRDEIEKELTILKPFGITYNKLIKITQRTHDNIIKRAGRVISLVKDEYGLKESKLIY